RFMESEGVSSYDELLRRAVEDPAWFWAAVVRDLGLEFYKPYEKVLDTSAGLPWTRWFTGGRINYVRNALDRWAEGETRERIAIRWEGDDGATRALTYEELSAIVSRLAGGLRALGVEKGDRVGIFMPMLPETAAATLAVSKLGAIYIPIFSGYGAEAVAARLRDAEAKLLITADGCSRRGKPVPMKETTDSAVRGVPSVE